MKKLLVALTVLVAGASLSHAGLIGRFVDDVSENTELTIFKSVTAGYFYDANHGKSRGGVITNVLEYRFLTFDGGWVTALESSERGAGVIGGGIDLGKFVSFACKDWYVQPDDIVKLFLPESAWKFYDATSIGLFSGYDFDREDTIIGVRLGMSKRF